VRIVGFQRHPWTDRHGNEHNGYDWNADNEFMCDEDGEVYFGLGHLDKEWFAFNATRVTRMMCYPEAYTITAAEVQWVYFVDAPERDCWRIAKRDEPGAFAVTRCHAEGYMMPTPDEVAP